MRSLEELEALRGVTAIVGGGLYITGEENTHTAPEPLMIPSLEPLRCLKRVAGEFALHYVEGLESLDDLQSLESVGSISLSNTTVTDLKRLASFEKLGALWIQGNSELRTLEGLSGLKEVGQLRLALNYVLDDIEGLSSLTSVKSLTLQSNFALERVDGFRSLKTVEGDLSIHQNSVLESLKGLHGVISVGGNLSIQSNPVLSPCEVEGLRDAIGAPNVKGEITIAGNEGSGDCTPP